MAAQKPTQLEFFPQAPLPRKGRGRVRLFNSEEEKQITAEYMAGAFLSDLERKWGGCKVTLAKIVRRNSGTVLGRVEAWRKYRCTFAPEEEKKIREEYESGIYSYEL